MKFDKNHTINVLVIGGTDSDPEVANVKKSFNTEIVYAGIETHSSLSPYLYLDLNAKIDEEPNSSYFELIMCNQVFEHLFDVKNALKVISSFCNDSTLVWIDFPTSTFPHGSPQFYTSGLMPDMIEKLALEFELKTIDSGVIGSKRDHLFGHTLNVWPTPRQSKHPFWSYYGITGNIFKKIIYQLKITPIKIVLATTSRRISEEVPFSTTGWIVLAK